MKPFAAILIAILLAMPFPSRGEIAYVLKAGNRDYARIITSKSSCPEISFDGKKEPMNARVQPGDGFPVLVCEAQIPADTKSIISGTIRLPVPVREPRRIVVLGDTGCRMKGSVFQDCNDPEKWPFKTISRAAARFKPDLVIHVGDYLYRETPCPEGRKGCEGSPHGYGYDVWNADFFSPADRLLKAAPWVFVRGNHEACFRAGKGWFRFLAAEPSDSCRDYSEPYSVALSEDTQVIVFDSSADVSNGHYRSQFEAVERLAEKFPHSFFLSHHPVLGFSEWHEKLHPGNEALQSAMQEAEKKTLFPSGIDAAFHGHVHLYEALDFKSNYPVTFVSGNSGTKTDDALPQNLPEGAEPFPGAIVKSFHSTSDFGFMTLEKRGSGWLITERNEKGQPVWSCTLNGRQCQ